MSTQENKVKIIIVAESDEATDELLKLIAVQKEFGEASGKAGEKAMAAQEQIGESTVQTKRKFQDAQEEMGKSAEKATATARLGFWGMGEAAENAAQSMGVPNQAARQLGNVVEGTVTRFGAAAAVIGVFGLAAMAAYGIVEHFTEAAKEKRKAIDDAVNSLSGEVDALYENTKATDEVRKAKYNLLLVEREMLQLRLSEKYQDMYDRLQQLNQEVQKGPAWYKSFGIAMKELTVAFFTGKDGAAELEKTLVDLRRNGTNEARQMAAELELIFARLKGLNITPSFANFTGAEAEMNRILEEERKADAARSREGLKAYQNRIAESAQYWEEVKAQREAAEVSMVAFSEIKNQRSLDAESAYSQALLDLSRSRGDSLAEQQQYELLAFDSTATAKYNALKTLDEQEAYLTQNEIKRMALVATQEQQTNSMRMQAAQQLTSNLSSAMQALYTAGGAHARKYFDMWKVAAISESTVKGIQAAINSFEFGTKLGGPPLGAAMAAASSLATGAMIVNISSQQFGGSGTAPLPAGGGVTPTSWANPTTGLSTSQPDQKQPQNITLIVNVNNPLSAENWDRIAEEEIIPALSRAGDRNVTVTLK